MKLLIDIGNTHIVSALSENDKLINSFRIPTNQALTEDLYAFYLETFLLQNHTNIFQVKKIILCSVVPTLHRIFKIFAKKYNIELFDIATATKLSFNLPYSIEERGNDRVAVIEGVIGYYEIGNFICIDCGTATTIDIIVDNSYVGGNILPGLHTAYKSLCDKADQLPFLEIVPTEKVFGITLQEQLSSGILHGYVGQLKYFISKIHCDYPNLPVFATGGVASILTPYMGTLWLEDKYLLEKGLHYIEKRHRV